jgi:hypothetical protein
MPFVIMGLFSILLIDFEILMIETGFHKHRIMFEWNYFYPQNFYIFFTIGIIVGLCSIPVLTILIIIFRKKNLITKKHMKILAALTGIKGILTIPIICLLFNPYLFDLYKNYMFI